MSRHSTRFNKRDANEATIIAALTAAGVEWIEAGPLDGWCWLGKWVPVEIKTAKGKLTAGQKAFISQCEMFGRPYRIWRNANEAIESIQVYREECWPRTPAVSIRVVPVNGEGAQE